MEKLTTEYLEKLKPNNNIKTIPCPNCDGTGSVDEINYARVNAYTISPPYHPVECDKCKGFGIIEIQDEEE